MAEVFLTTVSQALSLQPKASTGHVPSHYARPCQWRHTCIKYHIDLACEPRRPWSGRESRRAPGQLQTTPRQAWTANGSGNAPLPLLKPCPLPVLRMETPRCGTIRQGIASYLMDPQGDTADVLWPRKVVIITYITHRIFHWGFFFCLFFSFWFFVWFRLV